MSLEMRVSEASRLHLKKKELTQIRKAAKVLRDPGTTSSWKSPLSSSRSIPPPLPNNYHHHDGNHLHLDSHFNQTNTNTNYNNGSDQRVFLYNWKTHKSSSDKSALPKNDGNEDYYHESGSVQESVGDSLSDARNAGDSRSDNTYLGDSRSVSTIFGCRDTLLVSPSMKRAMGIRRKSKRTTNHLDVISRYQQKELNLRRLLKGHPSSMGIGGLGVGREYSVDQSDDTEDYSNSEDLRKISVASPHLLKLKHKNWSHSSRKLLKSSRKGDTSCSQSTPALSTSSYNRYRPRNPSTVESWDATTTSLNDGDDEVDDHVELPGRQGCGIPCYWSRRTPRRRGACRSCYSPSLSDTLRRKGSGMLCGSRSMYNRCRHSSSASNRQRIVARSAQGILPLLTYNGDGRGAGSSIGTGNSDDELSTNYGELDLEALSRLDGKRWSNCRSQEGLEIVALKGDIEDESITENIRSLSQKYKPVLFDELIGQSIVVQSLTNAIGKGRIAPVYLFQGPRGTGKTSTARIFASALNCMSTEETKPCGYCTECADFISGKTRDLLEVDGTNKKGIDKVRYILEKISKEPPSVSSHYKVFLIDECHLLPSKMWLTFLKFLEEPPKRVVFIFITTDPDNVPRTVQSRCQKYLFNKIKDADIVMRLRKISAEENLDVELDALDLIALNADGSLRDAETMLDQLSLLGKRITTSLVNELVGIVSDEKLLELLELAMSSDTAETVKRARDLMDSGVDPMILMSQLASLIMDVIAGTYNAVDAKYGNAIFGRRSLNEVELEKLKHALKLLSDAEKQLRVSSDRSTWFTATLLQLGSVPSPEITQSSSSRRQSSRTTDDDPSSASRDAALYKQKSDAHNLSHISGYPASLYKILNGKSSHEEEHIFNGKPPHKKPMRSHTSSASWEDEMITSDGFGSRNLELDDIWSKCIDRCHSKTLRQLLHAHGKLLSISEVEGMLVVYVGFEDENIKARAERFLSSITNSVEMVLRQNVEVRILHMSDIYGAMNDSNRLKLQDSQKWTTDKTLAIKSQRSTKYYGAADGHSDLASQQELNLSRGSFNNLEGNLNGGDYSKSLMLLDQTYKSSPLELPCEANGENSSLKEVRQEIPMQRIESIIHEQRLETAWLQAAEKGTPRSLSRLKPEKNQVLPQEEMYQNQVASVSPRDLSSQHWGDELNHDIKLLKMQDQKAVQKDQSKKGANCCPISPSLLHDSSFPGPANKESLGYESSTASGGCGALFCWNTKKPETAKAKGHPARLRHKGRQFSLFGELRKQKGTEGKLRI
ncbi:hypothetical protein K2173_015372 [Erythroxylum novogranatense]|uniref:AAA+ ATPase domain-containing protein n=1 Tax=Erythroxylum novogranatense TaxID=1862640 RepID=A0AAV8SSG8_9ROSI|nr:hypothetical protein K2173_015372 [Erythroxylum novogranatense]